MLTRNLILNVHRSLNHTRRLTSTRNFSSPISSTLEIPAQCHRRHASTSVPHSEVSMERYHELSDVTMDNLLDSLENLLDGLGNNTCEVEYHSGVLTLNLGDKGTYVINKQPPNKQIWLSSPFSGPKRYDYSASEDDWLYARDGRTMRDLLEDELTNTLGIKVVLDVGKSASPSQRPR